MVNRTGSGRAVRSQAVAGTVLATTWDADPVSLTVAALLVAMLVVSVLAVAAQILRTARSGRVGSRSADRVRDVEDRERVVALLEDAGGRLKQSRIVEETGWSKTKVSRLLSQMAADGDVVKVPVGRENIVCLPGSVPEAAGEH